MRQQGHVHDHLLIDELISFRNLDTAVQHQHASVRRALEYDDLLERRSLMRKHGRNGETLPPTGVQRFGDEFGHRGDTLTRNEDAGLDTRRTPFNRRGRAVPR